MFNYLCMKCCFDRLSISISFSLKDDIKTASENLLKIEHKFKVSRLTLEETQKEREEKYAEYEELRKSFLSKCEVAP